MVSPSSALVMHACDINNTNSGHPGSCSATVVCLFPVTMAEPAGALVEDRTETTAHSGSGSCGGSILRLSPARLKDAFPAPN